MDPVTAVGLASAIISFVPLGFQLLKNVREIRDSIDGSLDRNQTRKCIVDEMEAVSRRLKPTDQIRIAPEQKGVHDLALKCHELSQKILNILDKVKPKTKGSFENYRSAFRAWSRESDIKDLEKQLNECRDQLVLGLVDLSNQDSVAYSKRLFAIAENDASRLEELRLHMESIRKGVQVENLGVEACVQLRRLLGLQEEGLDSIYRQQILQSIRFEKMHDRYESVHYPHGRTYNWLLEDDVVMDSEEPNSDFMWPSKREKEQMNKMKSESRACFSNWLSSSEGIFHISGKLGSGKSTLMKLLYTHPKTRDQLRKSAGNKSLLVAQFFFWKPGTEFQKSLNGLYRSLLHDILQACPWLIQDALPELWEVVKSSPWQIQAKFDIPIDMAKSAIERIIFNSTECASEIWFCFFIDGLDEYEQSHGRDHVYLVKLLNNWAKNSQGRLKMVVSSRDYNVFLNAFSADHRLKLHELTWFDMRRYVRDELAHLENAELQDYFVMMIPPKANGIFLWVTLVINEIRKKIEDEASQEQLLRLLDSLPPNLEALFVHILNGLDANSRRTAYQTMSILRTAHWNYLEFTLQEFMFLEDYQNDPLFSIQEDSLTGTNGLLQNKRPHEIYLKRLRGICGGLVECYEPNNSDPWRPFPLSFTHRSIPEMLEREKIKQDMDSCLGTFSSVDALSHISFASMKVMTIRSVAQKLCADVTWMRLANRIDEPPYRFIKTMTSWVADAFDQEPGPGHLLIHQGLQVYNSSGLASVCRYGAITDRRIFPVVCQAAMVRNVGFVRWEFENASRSVNKPWKRALVANALLDSHLRDGMPIEDLKYFFEGLFLSNERAVFEPFPHPQYNPCIHLNMGPVHLKRAGRSTEEVVSSDGSDKKISPVTDGPQSVGFSYATSEDLTVWQRYLVSCFLGWVGRHGRMPYPFHRDRFGLAAEQFLEHGASSGFLASMENPESPTHVTLHFDKSDKDLTVDIDEDEHFLQMVTSWDVRDGRPSMSLRQWIHRLNPKNKDRLLRLLDSGAGNDQECSMSPVKVEGQQHSSDETAHLDPETARTGFQVLSHREIILYLVLPGLIVMLYILSLQDKV